MTDAEREARDRAVDESDWRVAHWDDALRAMWAAASEWCRADQTRALVEWARDQPGGALYGGRTLAQAIDREFPPPEQSGQAPSEQEETR